MYIKPVPLKLLIHTVTLRHKSNDGNWNDSDYTEQTLYHVRLEPKKTMVYSKENQQITMNSILFIDNTHSTKPDNISLDDDIVFNGEVFTIKSIDKHYALDSDVPHHYEIGLV